ncbi:hypothetical protein MAE30S32_20110, partial [Microcystis aeruginosa 11-30S32]
GGGTGLVGTVGLGEAAGMGGFSGLRTWGTGNR